MQAPMKWEEHRLHCRNAYLQETEAPIRAFEMDMSLISKTIQWFIRQEYLNPASEKRLSALWGWYFGSVVGMFLLAIYARGHLCTKCFAGLTALGGAEAPLLPPLSTLCLDLSDRCGEREYFSTTCLILILGVVGNLTWKILSRLGGKGESDLPSFAGASVFWVETLN